MKKGMLLLALVFVFMLVPSFAIYEDWQYYREITITEQSGNDLTDYQVLITLDSSNFDFSKINSDCSDLRFADANGNALSYYVETCDPSNSLVKVWVKVPSIPASGSTTIYMYYGNPSAASESNPKQTFVWYDDFSTDTSAYYSVYTGTCVYDSAAKALKCGSDSSSAWHYVSIKDLQIKDVAVDLYGYYEEGDYTGIWALLWYRRVDSSNTWRIQQYKRGEFYVYKFVDGSYTRVYEDDTQNTQSNFHLAVRVYNTEHEWISEYKGIDVTQTDADVNQAGGIYFGVYLDKAGHYAWFKEIIVRKYVKPEPAVSIGAEQSGVSLSVVIKSPEDGAILTSSTVTVTYEITSQDSTVDTIIKLDGTQVWSGAVSSGQDVTYTFNDLTDGAHTVEIDVTDSNSNTASDSVSFTVDTEAPSCSASIAPDETWHTTDYQDLTISCEDTATTVTMKVHYKDDPSGDCSSVDWSTVTAITGNPATKTFTLSDGYWVVCVHAEDEAGHVTDKTFFPYKVDKFAPNDATINEPTAGWHNDELGQIQYSLELSEYDVAGVTESGLASYTIYLKDNTNTELEVTSENIAGMTYNTGTVVTTLPAEIPDGEYTFEVKTCDVAGNCRITTGPSGYVDRTPPEITITSPEDGAKFTEMPAVVTFEWTASDAHLTSYRVWCDYDGIESHSELITDTTKTTYTCTYTEPGEYTFAVKAYDEVGNTKLDQVTIVAGDNVPQIEMHEPSVVYGVFLPINFTLGWIGVNDTPTNITYEVYVMNHKIKEDVLYFDHTNEKKDVYFIYDISELLYYNNAQYNGTEVFKDITVHVKATAEYNNNVDEQSENVKGIFAHITKESNAAESSSEAKIIKEAVFTYNITLFNGTALTISVWDATESEIPICDAVFLTDERDPDSFNSNLISPENKEVIYLSPGQKTSFKCNYTATTEGTKYLQDMFYEYGTADRRIYYNPTKTYYAIFDLFPPTVEYSFKNLRTGIYLRIPSTSFVVRATDTISNKIFCNVTSAGGTTSFNLTSGGEKEVNVTTGTGVFKFNVTCEDEAGNVRRIEDSIYLFIKEFDLVFEKDGKPYDAFNENIYNSFATATNLSTILPLLDHAFKKEEPVTKQSGGSFLLYTASVPQKPIHHIITHIGSTAVTHMDCFWKIYFEDGETYTTQKQYFDGSGDPEAISNHTLIFDIPEEYWNKTATKAELYVDTNTDTSPVVKMHFASGIYTINKFFAVSTTSQIVEVVQQFLTKSGILTIKKPFDLSVTPDVTKVCMNTGDKSFAEQIAFSYLTTTPVLVQNSHTSCYVAAATTAFASNYGKTLTFYTIPSTYYILTKSGEAKIYLSNLDGSSPSTINIDALISEVQKATIPIFDEVSGVLTSPTTLLLHFYSTDEGLKEIMLRIWHKDTLIFETTEKERPNDIRILFDFKETLCPSFTPTGDQNTDFSKAISECLGNDTNLHIEIIKKYMNGDVKVVARDLDISGKEVILPKEIAVPFAVILYFASITSVAESVVINWVGLTGVFIALFILSLSDLSWQVKLATSAFLIVTLYIVLAGKKKQGGIYLGK